MMKEMEIANKINFYWKINDRVGCIGNVIVKRLDCTFIVLNL